MVEINKRPELSEIKHEGKVMRSLCSQWNHMQIIDGQLCRQLIGDRKTCHRIVVPFYEREAYCNIVMMPEPQDISGVALEKVRERVYWTGLQQDVRNYIYWVVPSAEKERLIKNQKSLIFSPKDVLCQSWLKLAPWFWKRRF